MLPHSVLLDVVTNQKHVPHKSITLAVLMQAEYGQYYYPSLFSILVILFPSFPLEADRHTTHSLASQITEYLFNTSHPSPLLIFFIFSTFFQLSGLLKVEAVIYRGVGDD